MLISFHRTLVVHFLLSLVISPYIPLRNYYYYVHLSAFSSKTWVSWHHKGKPIPFRILLKQEMMEWQWHHLDHMQIICTSLQTDNHASTSPFSFYRLDALPATQPTATKH